MGLFDRLFGRKEEPKIEEVVKEALENLDLTEPGEEVEELGTEKVEVKITEEIDQSSEVEETYSKEASESVEPEAEATLETVKAETVPQEEETQFEEKTECHCCQEESESTEVEETEEADQVQPDETEADTSEEVEEDLVIEEIPQVQETVQEKYDRSLKKTRTGFGARLNAFFANFRSVDEDFFEELEELLIMSDVGVQVASNLTEELRYEAKLENAKKPDVLRRVIIEKLVELYEKDGQYNESINFQDGLTVMLFVGVNGVGKTTSIGKLANRYKQAGKKVMLVAADTFRAGAVAQLAEWGRRVDVPVVTGPEKADPASVVFDGMERAVAEGVDILMIDTAGRLQNKENLMAELEKIGRIIKRVVPEAPHETFLALDASTGQNALVQAKEFSKITPVTGIVLTKIDGTARGGVVLAIREELNIPVKLIGFGEKIDDIGEFNSENFMKGLLEGLI
ncbi:signal recognition particle-docking protein FtsY [Streptococcus infantis]|uniref:signal recognition particle-docking protein FtsY n=1 Tax=Streptococcus infantis TaxID=68892 RepID=UPI0039C096FE